MLSVLALSSAQMAQNAKDMTYHVIETMHMTLVGFRRRIRQPAHGSG